MRKLVTFQPFNMGKWFALGFCAFLAALDEEGFGNFNTNSFSNGSGGGGTGRPGVGGGPAIGNPFDDFTNWMSSHVGLVVLIGVLILLIFSPSISS